MLTRCSRLWWSSLHAWPALGLVWCVATLATGCPQVGLEVLRRKGTVLRCYANMAETVTFSEIGMSVAVLEAGYNIDSLMLRYQVCEPCFKSASTVSSTLPARMPHALLSDTQTLLQVCLVGSTPARPDASCSSTRWGNLPLVSLHRQPDPTRMCQSEVVKHPSASSAPRESSHSDQSSLPSRSVLSPQFTETLRIKLHHYACCPDQEHTVSRASVHCADSAAASGPTCSFETPASFGPFTQTLTPDLVRAGRGLARRAHVGVQRQPEPHPAGLLRRHQRRPAGGAVHQPTGCSEC